VSFAVPNAVSRRSHQRPRVFSERFSSGWLVWSRDASRYAGPDMTKSTFQPLEQESEETIAILKEFTTSTKFWEKLSTHFTLESHASAVVQDNISSVKSICKFPHSESDLKIYKLQSNCSRTLHSRRCGQLWRH
jgi:hypothetical protein